MARQRLFTSLVLFGIVVVSIVPVFGQEVPRNSSGKPDLQGVWDFRTITPMERPEDQAEEFLSDEEAADLDQAAIEREVGLRLDLHVGQKSIHLGMSIAVWTARQGRTIIFGLIVGRQ